MRIDIWSDIVCPFCYVGKRNLEQALAEFEHRDEVEVVWHSFELDPSATEHPAGSLPELIAGKYQMSLEHESILDIASEIGLDTAEVEAVLKSDRYAADVRADEQLARQLGINGVPFFLIESKWAVSGAQPAEMLVQALRQVWEETHRVEFFEPAGGRGW